MNNEVIQSYDYSNYHDGIIVSTNSCLSFYNLNENGNVHRVLFYDELGPTSFLKLQNSSQPLVATVRNNLFYLWDIEKKISPLVNYLSFTSPISAFNWSSVDSHIFAAGNNNGLFSIWDMRSLQKPMIKFDFGNSQFKGLKWSPTSNNFIATVLNQKYLTVLDIRMIRKNVLQEKLQTGPTSQCYKMLDFDSSLEDFSWSLTQPSIWTLGANKKCELWKIHSSDPLLVEKCETPLNISTTDFKISKIRPNIDDSTLLHQNEKNGVTKIFATDRYHQHSLGKFSAGSQKILGFNWRNPSFLQSNIQHSFVLVTKSGFVHLTEWTTEDFSIEEMKYRTILGDHPNPKSARRKNKISSSNLKNYLSEDPETALNDVPLPSAKAMSRLVVVGPVSFSALLNEDIAVISNSRKDGSLDGIRISQVDPFRRMVTVEFLIPTPDAYTMTAKSSSAHFTSYYKTDELLSFFRNSLPDRSIVLTITFSAKYSQFWNPKFSVENKSTCKVRSFINF
jgi:hypothetical protein